MRRVIIPFFVLLLIWPAASPAAETVQATVSSVDTLQNAVTVAYENRQTGAREQKTFTISPAAVFSESTTLDTLKAGDEILMETHQNAEGKWQAASIEVLNSLQ